MNLSTHSSYPSAAKPLLKPILMLTLIVGVFFVPMLLAPILLKHPAWLIKTNSSHGTLIKPPLAVLHLPLIAHANFSSQQLLGKWALIYMTSADCNATCYAALANLQKIHTALGKNSSRLHCVFLTSAAQNSTPLKEQLDTAIPKIITGSLDTEKLVAFFKQNNIATIRKSEGIFIADPKGNIILYYPPDINAKSVYQDLKLLLDVSQIG